MDFTYMIVLSVIQMLFLNLGFFLFYISRIRLSGMFSITELTSVTINHIP